MTSTWPEAIAPLAAEGHELGAANDVQRTQFDDGAVRQAVVYTAARLERRVTAEIADADLAAWQAWVRASAHTWFDFRDPHDGVLRRARVRGGAGGVALRQAARGAGAPAWRASMTIEGPAEPA